MTDTDEMTVLLLVLLHF